MTGLARPSVDTLQVHVTVTITQPFLGATLSALAARPAEVLLHSAGLRRAPGELEILLPGPARPAPTSVTARLFRPPAALRRVSHRYWEAFDRRRYGRATLDLALDGEDGGSAALLVGRRVFPVSEVRVIGAGMRRWIPGTRPAPDSDETPRDGRHSRYAGALGGSAVLARLQRLSAVILGTGSWAEALAEELRRAGLTLLSPCAAPRADLIVTAGPSDSLNASALACAYHRPQLDLRTNLHAGTEALDVDLHLPGSRCCRSCAPDRSAVATRSAQIGPALRSFGLGLAMTALECLVRGGLEPSVRRRAATTASGILTSIELPPRPDLPPDPPCPWAGMGDRILDAGEGPARPASAAWGVGRPGATTLAHRMPLT